MDDELQAMNARLDNLEKRVAAFEKKGQTPFASFTKNKPMSSNEIRAILEASIHDTDSRALS